MKKNHNFVSYIQVTHNVIVQGIQQSAFHQVSEVNKNPSEHKTCITLQD